MKTKKITLYYSVTSREVKAPGPGDMNRKDYWIKELQSTVQSDWQPKTVRVTYEVYDIEVDKMRKFLNGPVIEYWIIQSQEIHTGDIDSRTKKLGRETLFDKALGYDVQLVNGSARRRRSTADFTQVQEMHDFLEMLRETEFEPNGYEFPDSEYFWKMSDAYGYDGAKGEALKQLQSRMRARLGTQ